MNWDSRRCGFPRSFPRPRLISATTSRNYTDIAPEYGTMDDALQLIDEVHKRGMKIVFDMVMNHTSDQHPWFKESRSSRDNPKADWYHLASAPLQERGWGRPNNWKSMTGGSGWHYAEERGQYFWSSFLPFQPDLNYRNPEVKKAMFDIVRFWLGKGVDGFRLDIFNVIYKDAEFRDNPFAFQLAPNRRRIPLDFFRKQNTHLNQPESFEFARELRSVCDEFGEKILLGEVSGDREIIRKFLGDETNNGLGLIFDFEMLDFQIHSRIFPRIDRENRNALSRPVHARLRFQQPRQAQEHQQTWGRSAKSQTAPHAPVDRARRAVHVLRRRDRHDQFETALRHRA